MNGRMRLLVKDVGGGLLIATVKDAAGSTLGLRQSPR
jgi:hypothetical protein